MGVKRSFKKILTPMTSKWAGIKSLSMLLTVVMVLQLAVVPASAGLFSPQTQTGTGETASESTNEGGVTDMPKKLAK